VGTHWKRIKKDQGKRVIWEVPKPGDCWDGMTPLIYVLVEGGQRTDEDLHAVIVHANKTARCPLRDRSLHGIIICCLNMD
jgi:hypothetical protein